MKLWSFFKFLFLKITESCGFVALITKIDFKLFVDYFVFASILTACQAYVSANFP